VSDQIAHWIVGDGQNNTLTGTDSNDYLNGSGGNDILTGRAGNDVYVVDTAQDQIVETSGGGIDRVESWAGSYTLPNWVENLLLSGSYTQTGIGNGLANQITGGNGANAINGQAGDDFLNGKAGNDTLTGGTGKDIFVLDTSANRDTLTDFNVTDDSIYLDNAVFQKIGEGTSAQPLLIRADTFLIGDRARDANDYLIYRKDNGALYYDADGSGASAPIQIAALSKNLAITYKDFFVI
jgi:Ca2+-binding RTX toxin-like protein